MLGKRRQKTPSSPVSDFLIPGMMAGISKTLVLILLYSCNPLPNTQKELEQALTEITKTEEDLKKQQAGSKEFEESLKQLDGNIYQLESLINSISQINKTNDSIPERLLMGLEHLKDYAKSISNFSDPSSKDRAIDLFIQYQRLATTLRQQLPNKSDKFDIVIAKILSNIAATYSESPSSNYDQLLNTQQYLDQALTIRQQTGTDSTQLLINRSNVCISLASNTTYVTKQTQHLLEGYHKIKPLLQNNNLKSEHKHMIANNLATIGLLLQDIAINHQTISIPQDIQTIKDIEKNYLPILISLAPYRRYQQILKHASTHQIHDQALSKTIFENLSFEDLGTISDAVQITQTIAQIYSNVGNTQEYQKYQKINTIIQMIHELFKDNLNQTVISLQSENAQLSEKRSSDILWYSLSIGALLLVFGLISVGVSKSNQQKKRKAERDIASKNHNLEQMADAMSHIVNGYYSKLAGLCHLITENLLTIESGFLLINDMITGPFGIAMKNLQDYSSIAQGEASQESIEDTVIHIIPSKTLETIKKIQKQYPTLKIIHIDHANRDENTRICCEAEWYEKAINMAIDNAIKFTLAHHLPQENNQEEPTIVIQSKIQDNRLIITISDNGPGFDDKFVEDGVVKDIGSNPSVYNIKQRGMMANAVVKLDPPYQSDRGSGNGIGLALVHVIMKGSGRDVVITSSNQGSMVEFSFPLAKTSATKKHPTKSPKR